MNTTCSQPDRRGDIVKISMLLTVALCLGIYLVITTTLISEDGVTFIKYAQGLNDELFETIQREPQHPAYPLLILSTYKTAQFLGAPISVWTWIYSGQSVALVFRLSAVLVLFYIGRKITSSRMSFWAILILIVLPLPAEYGSDVLSDWPNMFFMAAGFLLLLHGAKTEKSRIFGFAGLVAGIGYLIRPECAQLIVFGVLWLAFQFFRPKRLVRGKTILALLFMLAGFLVIAGPYMIMKGAVFPKKNVGRFTQESIETIPAAEDGISKLSVARNEQGFSFVNTAGAILKLAENTGRTLMWFFVPALFIGAFKTFKEQRWIEPEKFLMTALIVLNIFLMIWLYCKYGYMSTRHTMAMLVLTVFYIPIGLEVLAFWIESHFGRSSKQPAPAESGLRFWFVILAIIGVSICIPKLLTSIRAEKHTYRIAADWLKANSKSQGSIAVPDKRIAFYAEREGLIYDNGKIPENAVYVVRILETTNVHNLSIQDNDKVEYEYVDEKNGKTAVVYGNF